MSTNLNLKAASFVPRRKAGNATNTSGSKSIGDQRAKTQPSQPIGSQQKIANSQTPHQGNQQSPQQMFKSLLYWEPHDMNGSILDEAYCIECIPSDFWQRLGDLNDTIKTFEKNFNTTFK